MIHATELFVTEQHEVTGTFSLRA